MILNILLLHLGILLLTPTIQAEMQQTDTNDHHNEESTTPEQNGGYTIGVTYINASIAYTGAAIPGSKEYSIVQHYLTQQGDALNGITPPRVQINYVPDQINPLYDKQILHLINSANKPVAVPADIPNIICLLENTLTSSNQSLITTPPLNDVLGNESYAIAGLETAITGTSDSSLHIYTVAAVTSHHGFFGDKHSGFSLIKHDSVRIKKEDEEEIAITASSKPAQYELKLNVLDAINGIAHGNRALPLGIDQISSAININGGLESIEPNTIAMCWHPNIERLYIALHIKTKTDATQQQGARALLIGRIKKNKLILDPILSDELCQENNTLISAVGPNQEISLHKVVPFITSTGVRYLLVLGGHGAPHTTQQTLSALPLAHRGYNKTRKEVAHDPLHGVIAAKSDITHAIYGHDKKLTARLLTTPATTKHDLLTYADPALHVGNHTILPHNITDIVVSGDAVFVSVAQYGNGQQPGIFYSQAILNDQGSVAAWTSWQRFGINVGVAKFSINSMHYATNFLYSDFPLFCQTTWKQPLKRKKNEQIPPPDDTLEGLVETIFPQEKGGLQGLHDFPCTTPGLNAPENPISIMVATGQKKVALIKTGETSNNTIFYAHKNMFLNTIAFTGDKYASDVEPKTLVLTDPVLESLGSITCAAIGTNGEQSWLFVGGARGVAVLSDVHGNGWSNNNGIISLFATKAAGLSFKKCGNHRFIQKLIGDNNNLYIITNTSVERIALSSASLKTEKTQTLVQCSTEIIFDGSVSGPLLLLGTSNGLFHNAPGTDVRLATQPLTSSQLRCSELSSDSKCVYKLHFVTRTHLEHDFAYGAQVFASTGSLADNKTDVFRIYIDNVYENGITQESVQVVNNQLYRNSTAPFLSFNNFRSNFVTDGCHHFSSRSRQTTDKPFLYMIPQEMIKRVFVSDHLCYQMPLQVHKANNIVKIVQNSATGNWIVAGDFGIRSNE